ncbi:MAG: macro domain-containing protein [Calditrichaeota bacterium]|nr:MAG: macro domain-containing protein [Calditrichota bacterium]
MNREIATQQLENGKVFKLVQGDITEEPVDAIVNAANSYLKHGGGVAAAIVRKGGPEIQEESDRVGYVPVGHAAITGAGKLPAKYVIHAVGPRWGEGDEDNKLRNAVLNSLKLAEEKGLTTLSLPAISAGIFGFPKDRCARIILSTVRDYLESHPEGSLQEVRICLFDAPTVEAFQEAFKAL